MVTELLKQLVSIPSISGTEAPIATFVYDYLQSNGLSPQRSGDNVWVEVGNGKGPRVMLNSHYDTVPAGKEWTRAPFEPVEENGKLYGLGSNDAKASVASMMQAVVQLSQENKNISGTIVLALVCNEETGRLGLETIIDKLMPLDAAIVGEPNGLQICIAQKGILVLNVAWKGVPAHAAHGTKDNAIQKSLEDLAKLYKIKWDKVDAFLGETTLQITQLHAGDRVNVIPGELNATLDIRYSPIYSTQDLLGMVSSEIKGQVSVYSDRRRAVKTDPESAIVQAAQKAQPKNNLVGSKTSSDWIFLVNVPAIKMGPGNTEISHTANEFIEISQVEKAVGVYKDTLKNFFHLT